MLGKLFVAIVVVAIAYVAEEIHRRHWYYHTLNRDDFQFTPQLIEHTVPTTYYDEGKLGDVLDKFDDRFHLYRLKEGQTFEFNTSKIEFPVLAHKVPKKMRPQSTLCSPPFHIETEEPVEVNTSQIFGQEGWYASFAKMSRQDAEYMFNTLKLPMSFQDTEKEHGFISNFDKPLLTSPIHAAPTVLSMAVQLIGSKSWVFVPNKEYEGEFGFSAVPVASVMRPQRVPKRFNSYLYTSQPGDVLFFPEAWGHIVYTHPGPCVLMNFRNIIPMNFLRQPINFITAIVNAFLFGTPPTAVDNAGQKNEWPAVGADWVKHIGKTIDKTLCPDGDLTEFDKYMVNYIKTNVDNKGVNKRD